MDGESRLRLRTTFEEVPELYDRARPRYPEELFDDLAALARLPAGARLVEIGCGTGQATVPLAARGFRITCVELGEGLAGVARRRLAAFPEVEVVVADFEAWEPPRAGFDAVVAFSAFHWLDPRTRYAKCASLLADGGSLAVVEAKHVLPPDGDPFFAEVQADYEAVLPDDPATRAGGPRGPETVGDLRGELEASGLFAEVAVCRRLWDVVYSADEYLAVLDTFSGNRALDPATRGRLYALIRRRIEARPGATVRKTLLATLNVGRRRA